MTTVKQQAEALKAAYDEGFSAGRADCGYEESASATADYREPWWTDSDTKSRYDELVDEG